MKEYTKLSKARKSTFTHSLMLETPVSVDVCPTALSPTAVKKRAAGPKILGSSLMRRKRLVSRIWLDKVLARETEVQI